MIEHIIIPIIITTIILVTINVSFYIYKKRRERDELRTLRGLSYSEEEIQRIKKDVKKLHYEKIR